MSRAEEGTTRLDSGASGQPAPLEVYGNEKNPDGPGFPGLEHLGAQGGSKSKSKRKRRPGPKGPRRSMGRFPWLTYSNAFVDAVKKDLSNGKQGTVQEYTRKLQMLGRYLDDLKARGLVKATPPSIRPGSLKDSKNVNPIFLKKEDIEAYVRWAKDEKGLKASTIAKQIGLLKGLTLFVGNPVIEKMRQLPGKSGLPTPPPHGPKICFSEETVLPFLTRVQKHAELTDSWWDIAAFGFAVVYSGTGLRPKEARKALLKDLDTVNCRLWVSNPKGQGEWTEGDFALILKPFRPYMQAYLNMRQRHMDSRGMNPTDPKRPLIPRLYPPARPTVDPVFFEAANVRNMFVRLRKLTGIGFRPKDGRPSYGQLLKDRGVPIEDCSVLLRHTNVKTTQAYYVSLRPDKAFRSVDKYFENEPENGPALSIQSPRN